MSAKHIYLILLFCIMALATFVSARHSHVHRAALAEHMPHQLLIKYRSPSDKGVSEVLSATEKAQVTQALAAAQGQLAERLGISEQRQLQNTQWHVVRFAASVSTDEALWLALANPAVEMAEPNYVLHLSSAVVAMISRPGQAVASPPSDPGFSNQWALQNTGQFGGLTGSDLGALAAWQIASSHRVIVVAVLDTGVDYTHPDLANRIWTNPGEVAGNGIDDDHNGFIDDVRGWNFVARNNDPMDDNYHGTLVAGAIAAETNNGIGIAGVAGTTEVRIMPLKFFDAGAKGTTAAAIEAIDYATRNGARIINTSWGDTVYSQALFEAARRSVTAGCLIVSAAGNLAGDNDSVPVYPANFNSGPNALSAVISVAGTDELDRLLDSSNYGARSVDLAAPGNYIYSTLPSNAYGYINGTSIATALVSGVAALVWAKDPALTNAQVKQIVRGSVRAAAAVQSKTISGGVAQAYQALIATPPYFATNTVVSASAADYVSTTVAPDSIVAAFGTKLATRIEVAQGLPLPTSLAGTIVKINGVAAPLFAVTPGQVNLLIPSGLPSGPAEIKVIAGDGSISSGAITIVPVQPGIFTSNQSGSGAPAGLWTPDGLNYFPVGRPDGTPIPMDAGGYLVLPATGLRYAPNADGSNSNGVAESVQVSVGGTPAPVLYAGAQGTYAGLDQVNLQVPASLRGRGQVELVMTVAGRAANRVVISVR